jgi:hypothetical protein
MNDDQLFAFENDFVASLRCIPMAVRLKLDRVAIKLTLRQWSRFTPDDRKELLEASCGLPEEIRAYRARLIELVRLRAREDARPLADQPSAGWEAAGDVPPALARHARSVGLAPPTADQWRALSPLQRFALIKLTRDNHDNLNFFPAMREFGLAPGAPTARLTFRPLESAEG